MLKLQCSGVGSRDTADKAHCKRTQHCWPTTPNSVGSYCVRLHVAQVCKLEFGRHLGACVASTMLELDLCKRIQHYMVVFTLGC